MVMRVEVSMNKSFRGYIEQYAEEHGITLPQAYRELLEVGLACTDSDFESLPVSVDEMESKTHNGVRLTDY